MDSIVKVVGDGYGVVYSELYVKSRKDFNQLMNDTVVMIDGARQTAPFQKNGGGYVWYRITDEKGAEYRVYPFVKSIVNADPKDKRDPFDFYTEVRLAPGGEGLETAATYFFNPHFAKTVVNVPYSDNAEARAAEIADARNLDGRMISAYEWADFTCEPEAVKSQEPIGQTAATAFRNDYNGGCYYITDVSFISEEGLCVGMFGCNTGSISNTVLATDYLPDDAGNLVHYGDWQEAPDLGRIGVFYWEHEEGGSNSG